MSLKTLMNNSVQHNLWVYEKYHEWLSPKSDEQLNQEVPSSFTSILKTMHHIWQTQEYWWSHIGETEAFDINVTNNARSREEVFAGILRNSQALATYVAGLDDEALLKPVKVVNQWFECTYPKYEYIQHILMHGTYHRGQIVTIGRNVGITDAPMVDYNFWKLNGG